MTSLQPRLERFNGDPRERRRTIDLGGAVHDTELPLERAELLEIHRQMVLLRTYDERSVVLQRQGRIGTYAICWGHEALQVGSATAAAEADWLFPSYRESAIGLSRGMDPTTVLAWWRGHPAGWWDPHEHGVASVTVPIATQIPHAVGFSWGRQLAGEPGCALVYFGDGATSEGAFHEAVNFAAVFNTPTVLICNNNGWAISTPLSRQTKVQRLARKAAAYGIPAERVDGGDVLAVRAATRRALERARSGGGPTFIEAVTMRAAPHATADDPLRYMEREHIEVARQIEPLGRFERYLIGRGILTHEDASNVRGEAAETIDAAVTRLEALPAPDPSSVFDRTYSSPPGAGEA